ncbi:MAG: AAA family ATPase [Reyranellaceae bacterium]
MTDQSPPRYAAPSVETLIGATVRYIPPKPNGADHATGSPYPFLHLSQITYDPNDERWVVAGLLPAEGLAVIYGKPKSKKSFIALDIAIAVAAGKSWAGMATSKAPVVIVAGEGAKAMRKRIAAYRKHGAIPDQTPIVLVPARPNLGVEKGDLPKLVQTIAEALGDVVPGLVILDTLARMLGGENENAEGMQNFINNAEALSEHHQCLTLAVHHEPHTGDRMRGHSSLPGAMVASLRVQKVDSTESTLTLEEAKDIEDGVSFAVHFRSVNMGFDKALNKEATTLIVDRIERTDSDDEAAVATPKGATKKTATRIPASLRAFMTSVGIALSEKGAEECLPNNGPKVRAVDIEAVRAVYYGKRADLDNADSKGAAFRRLLRKAIEEEVLIAGDLAGKPMVWLPSAKK